MKYASCLSLLIVWLIVLSLIGGCEQRRKAAAPEKEVLVYCGITMIKPMAEIAKVIEAREHCKIIITKGGSGNLLKAIHANQIGDLYLPGSDSYIKTCREEGVITEEVFVGYNKAAMMVQKGNPKGISADLDNLTSKNYYVVIGNPSSGSIGRETRKILEKKGIFDGVVENARHLTTDSKDLIGVLKSGEADLVINWYATSTWEENRDAVDFLPIDEKYADKKKLVLGLLKTARYPEIARQFMAYAASPQGQEIFDRYGLYNVR